MAAHHVGNPWTYLRGQRSRSPGPINAIADNTPYAGLWITIFIKLACCHYQCYREVQQLRGEVRESDQVKFAVDIYTALNSYNYVKFFKLIHSATFLDVCILHRYFNQMRACCLQRLRAYVMPGHTAAVRLQFYVCSYFWHLNVGRWTIVRLYSLAMWPVTKF